jgi:flavin reductase (DIM6/NTAB) family NADH-FMN oxidoreductase RutF
VELKENVVPSIDDRWENPDEFETIVSANKPFSLRVPALVVTRGLDGMLNVMLAMWFTPMGTRPSSFLVAVSRKTKSHDTIMETRQFVIAAPDESMLDIALYAGAVSGFTEDKWSACGLTPLRPKIGKVPLVREALANIELEVSQTLPFDDEYVLVVGKVLACHVKSEFFRGGIYQENASPLLWLGRESGTKTGDKTATHYVAGMGRTWAADHTSPLLSKIRRTPPS